MGTLVIRTTPGARVAVEQVRHEFWFGATLPGGVFSGRTAPEDIAKWKQIFTSHFNAGVPEADFKWDVMEKQKGQVNYTVVDNMLAWAAKEGIALRGHCIFWGVPNHVQPWLKEMNDEDFKATVAERGRSIGARYRGRFAEYDLNNEMMHANYYEQRFGIDFTRQMALWVKEGDLAFRVNLFDYLDTGLFLDHRPVRARIGELARGTRFLNLFCYTASASVHAAAGGARTTTSVDLSGTYLEWASRNFARNGFTGAAHLLAQADVLSWLAHDRGEYDLIFVDPPTFSNSKRTDDFDVQRDHVRLLELCVARLARDGLVLFSTNARRFRLERDALGDASVRDITPSTIPFDFARNPRIHACFELVHAHSDIANR